MEGEETGSFGSFFPALDGVGERVLLDAGVHVYPDVLCNAGGVVVSYCEWLQNMHHRRWTQEDVERYLDERMRATVDRVHEEVAHHATMRVACFTLAVRAVDAMMQLAAPGV